MGRRQVSVVVTGRVQGVYFRASTEREAKRLGVTGWVKNRADGAVELCVEGDDALVDELVRWAHVGPPSAKVERVQVETAAFTGELSDFRVVG